MDPIKNESNQTLQNAHGASCLEFEPSIPTKFMVGTDRGKPYEVCFVFKNCKHYREETQLFTSLKALTKLLLCSIYWINGLSAATGNHSFFLLADQKKITITIVFYSKSIIKR